MQALAHPVSSAGRAKPVRKPAHVQAKAPALKLVASRPEGADPAYALFEQISDPKNDYLFSDEAALEAFKHLD